MSKADKKKETLLGLHTKRADDFGKWYSEVRPPPRVGDLSPRGGRSPARRTHRHCTGSARRYPCA